MSFINFIAYSATSFIRANSVNQVMSLVILTFRRGDHVEVKRLDARTLSLVIRNASSSDSGVYTCTAHTANAKYHKAVDVVVFGQQSLD